MRGVYIIIIIWYIWFGKTNCILYIYICIGTAIYIITMLWPNVRVKSAKCLDRTVTRQIERVEKRWTPFINVFVHHMLRVCVAFPFSSSLERPYGLYIRAVCSQGIEIHVRHMVHDIRCIMNACEYNVVISTLYLRKKKSFTRYRPSYIVFRVSLELTCIIILLRPAACVRNLCMVHIIIQSDYC